MSCNHLPNPFISFEAIHKHFKQSTPVQIGNYAMSQCLFGIYNEIEQTPDWLSVTMQIIMTGRHQYSEVKQIQNRIKHLT